MKTAFTVAMYVCTAAAFGGASFLLLSLVRRLRRGPEPRVPFWSLMIFFLIAAGCGFLVAALYGPTAYDPNAPFSPFEPPL